MHSDVYTIFSIKFCVLLKKFYFLYTNHINLGSVRGNGSLGLFVFIFK